MEARGDLAQDLRAWAEGLRGPLVQRSPAGHAWGEAEVWRLCFEGGEVGYLKRHLHARNYAQERDAYVAWGPRLGAWVPALWGRWDARGALLLAEAPGVSAARAGLGPGEREAVHRLAGEFHRALREVPHLDDDPLPLSRAIPKRAQAWCARARKLLEPALVEPVERAFVRGEALFEGARRAPAHRDFCPRNWVVRGRGEGALGLTVLDLGHARADHPLMDWVKLWDEVWREEPGLMGAWLDGVGRAPTQAERAQLAALVQLHALGTVLWARSHGAQDEEARGRAALRDALAWSW